jgi:hypothetical protein
MSDTQLLLALDAAGWVIMRHHGPGPKWGAIHGHGAVVGIVHALKAGGYKVEAIAEPGVRVEAHEGEAGRVLARWASVESAAVRVLAGVV